MDVFQAFTHYHVLKLHFTTTYDGIKYNWQSNITPVKFMQRKDKMFFYRVAKNFKNEDEYKQFLVANLLVNPKLWGRDLLSPAAQQIFEAYQKRQQSLAYQFTLEVDYILDQAFLEKVNATELFKVIDGQAPRLFEYLQHGQVSLETFIILDMIIGFIDVWNKKIEDTIIWPDTYKKIVKYKSFLSIDLPKYKKIFSEKIKNTN